MLIRIIKLVSGSNDQVLIFVYNGYAVAALIALFLLIFNVAKVIAEEQ